MRRVQQILIAVLTAWAIAAGAGTARAQLGSLLSPGPLARPHASLEGVANCAKCHEQGRRVTAQKCLACHQPIAQRIARKVGVHKDAGGECVLCHAEHAGVNGELRPFDQKAFDHAAVTGFALTGKHVLGAQQCAACHKGRSFVDASPACAACHTDVHKPSLGSNCTTCHSTQAAFTAASTAFDHNTAAFRLNGAHTKVACASCHIGGVFKGVKFASCVNCHKEPHQPSLGSSCTTCHTTDSWRTTNVNHQRTSFPLAGAHTKVACASCHKQPPTRVTLKSDTCASCHADVHAGQFTQDCKACHTDTAWKGGRFDHATTTFALRAKHAPLTCDACHRPQAAPARVAARIAAVPTRVSASATPVVDFRGLKATCVSCHTDVHQGELGTSCETCHSDAAFAVRAYTHKTGGPFFAGQHAALTCEQCHTSLAPARPVRTGTAPLAVRFAAAARGCGSCHKDIHLGQFTASCETCHSVETAQFAVTIDHARQTSFVLTGKHGAVACRGCHKVETGRFPAAAGTAVRLKGVGATCVSCHKDVHLGQLVANCESCHTSDTFHLATYAHKSKTVLALMTGAHARASCVDCHKATTGRFPAGTGTAIRFTTGTACVSCHVDQHRGGLGPNCGNCHRP